MKINIDGRIRVRLTPHGQELISKHYATYNVHWQPSADGWYKLQLWELMGIFGPYLYVGCIIPFEDAAIYMEEDD